MLKFIELLKKRKSLISSGIALVISLAVMVTVVFGWFLTQRSPTTDEVILQIIGTIQGTLDIYTDDDNGEEISIPYGPGGLFLYNLLPLRRYTFKIKLSDFEAGTLFDVVFIANGRFTYEENGETKIGDMLDIFKIYMFDDIAGAKRISDCITGTPMPPPTNETELAAYITEYEDYLLAANVSPNEDDYIIFTIIFSDDPPNYVTDINIYQERNLSIRQLRIINK